MTRALEPYEINYKDFIAVDKATNKNECRNFSFVVFLVIVMIKCVYGLLLPKADQFAANYPYSIQCSEIESSFQNQNSSAFADYALLDRNYVSSTQQIGIYQCFCLSQEKDSAICGEYESAYLKLEIAAVLVPMFFSFTLISTLTKILEKGGVLNFKSQIV